MNPHDVSRDVLHFLFLYPSCDDCLYVPLLNRPFRQGLLVDDDLPLKTPSIAAEDFLLVVCTTSTQGFQFFSVLFFGCPLPPSHSR
jgi:hypothetical protein